MKASLRSVRIAPKKANLIAKLVRGMSVPDAVEALRRTNKKGARMMAVLLRSAIANASHNEKQDPQMMVIKTVVVNQGTAYRRGMPKARGQTRPYRKFLSHIDIVLGFPEVEDSSQKKSQKLQRGQRSQKNADKKVDKKASVKAEKGVKNHGSAEEKKTSKSKSSETSETSDSSASS